MARRQEQMGYSPSPDFVDPNNLDPEQPFADMEALLGYFPNTPEGGKAKEKFMNLCEEYLGALHAQKKQKISGMLQHHGEQRAAKHNDIHRTIGRLSTTSKGSNVELFSRLGDRHYVTEMLNRYFTKVDFEPGDKSIIAKARNNPNMLDPELAQELSAQKRPKGKRGSA